MTLSSLRPLIQGSYILPYVTGLSTIFHQPQEEYALSQHTHTRKFSMSNLKPIMICFYGLTNVRDHTHQKSLILTKTWKVDSDHSTAHTSLGWSHESKTTKTKKRWVAMAHSFKNTPTFLHIWVAICVKIWLKVYAYLFRQCTCIAVC